MKDRLAVIAALAGMSACSPSGFICEEDRQCSLAGEPGVCLASGRCAYPNPECPSGLALPEGADQNPGACVPGTPVGSPPLTTTTSGASSGPGPGASTGPSDTDCGSDCDSEGPLDSSSGDPACVDPYEPNDALDEAAVLPLEDAFECALEWTARLDQDQDVDWFLVDRRDLPCPPEVPILMSTELPLENCVTPRCASGVEADINFCSGDMLSLPGQTVACCGTTEVVLDAACPNADMLVGLAVVPAGGQMECLPYGVLLQL